MSKNTKIKGTGVAIVTPFHKNKEVDFTSLSKVVSHVLDGNTDFVVALGTTSESVTLSNQEAFAVLEHTLDCVEERVPVVVGVSGNCTTEVISKVRMLKDIAEDRFSAVLVSTPYYNKPTQQGLYEHFKVVANALPTPIILYNIPGRTGVNLNAETCLRLAEENKNIIGLKEASGNMAQCMEILRNKKADFAVFSGDDALTMPLMSLGMSGVISVTANAFPQLVSQMVNYCLKGDYKQARKIHEMLLPFSNAIFEEGNPAGIKTALEILGLLQNNLRLPLVKGSRGLYNKITEIIKKLNK
ncbi:MAG: 4-hydroxy-tetrahydrodipicolinate synthase [Bacteroidales bacterium]|jgi:4-hydroxy-tetrahydrodipicolinate synthase|nr:4-hydroxy-tetrahydrodipicolinate synthase [Bacteroidales bacterium]